MTTTELLFNPFKRYAGLTSLIVGIIVIVLTAAIAVAGQTHLDGVIDLHVGTGITFTQAIGEGLINFLCMGIVLYIASLFVSPSRPRVIDIFGTQALARTPFFFAAVANLLPNQDQVIKYVEYKYMNAGNPVELGTLDILFFAFATLVTLLCLVWMIALMYRAYAVSANVHRAKGIVSFIVGLIVAEITSKILISNLIL